MTVLSTLVMAVGAVFFFYNSINNDTINTRLSKLNRNLIIKITYGCSQYFQKF